MVDVVMRMGNTLRNMRPIEHSTQSIYQQASRSRLLELEPVDDNLEMQTNSSFEDLNMAFGEYRKSIVEWVGPLQLPRKTHNDIYWRCYPV